MADFTGVTSPQYPPVIGRAFTKLAIAAVDQGDGTGAILVTPTGGGGATSGTPTQVANATSATQLLAANASRVGWVIYNTSATATVWLGVDNTVTTSNSPMSIPPQTWVSSAMFGVAPGAPVWEKASAADGNANIIAYPS